MDTIPQDNTPRKQAPFPGASGIYKITCIVTGKFYIGSTSSLSGRRRTHLHKLRLKKHDNVYLQNAWNKYGEASFIFEVVEYVLPISLTAREQYWVNKLRPFGKRGFNLAPVAGSRLGIKDSPETREKKRKARVGRTPSLGHKPSPESIEKMRQSHRGHPVTAETRKKISQGNKGNKSRTGMTNSPEAREKIRQSKIGLKKSPSGRMVRPEE